MAQNAKTSAAPAQTSAAIGDQMFKDAVEKSLNALNDLTGHSKSNFEAAVASVSAAAKGGEALRAQFLALSKKAFEDNVASAKALAGARSLQDVVELQASWMKAATETYIAELGTYSEMVANSIKDSLAPISDRVSAAVNASQADR